MATRKSRIRWFLLVLVGLPAIVPLLLISQYAVNTLYMDDWDIGPPLFEKVSSGQLKVADLFAQANEHRIVFSRLVLLALAPLTHNNVKTMTLVTVVLAWLHGLNIYLLCRRTVGGSFGRRVALCFIANLLLFAPIQMDDWLWWITGTQFFAPTVCLTAGLVVAGSRARRITRYLGCIALATIATFSNGDGMMLWLLLLPQLMWGPPAGTPKEQTPPQAKRRFITGPLAWIILWIVAAALNFFFYFHHYYSPPNPSPGEAWAHPLKYLAFFLTFLGSVLSRGTSLNPVTQAITVGTILLLMFIGISGYAFYIWRWRRDARLIGRMLPWMLAATYSIGCAAVISFGRLGLGIEGGLTSRYTTLSMLLVVSLIFLVPLALDRLIGADDAPSSTAPARSRYTFSKVARFLERIQIGPLAAARITAGLGAVLILLHLFTTNEAISFCQNDRIRRLEGKACLLFIKQFKEDMLPWTVYQGTFPLKQEAEQLDGLGYIRPPLIKSSNVSDILGSEDMGLGLDGNFGNFDGIQGDGKDRCMVAGWAVFPGRGQPADAVLLTWQIANGPPTIFAVAAMGTPREDIADKLGNSVYQYCGWSKVFSADRLPNGNLLIRAWAFDTASGKAFALNGQASIKKGL